MPSPTDAVEGSPARGLLRFAADRRSLMMVTAFFVLSFAGYFLHGSLPWYAQVPLIVITSVVSFSCAVITHNTVHAPVFHSRALNRVFQVVLTLAYGHPVSAFVPGHNLSHHVHTQTRRDVMRTTKLRWRWNLLNQLFFLPTVAIDITRADAAYAKAMRKERPRWFRQYVTEYAIFGAFSLALLIYDWQGFILYQMIPHTFAAWAIVGINFVQHDGCDQNHPYNHSRNLVGSWMNWWFFNNGYHGIHHDEPGLHWSLLPAVHAERIHGHIHPNLEVPDFIVYCWQAYVWPGKRLDYLGNPVVLPPEGPDESWIPGRGDTPNNVSLGAEA